MSVRAGTDFYKTEKAMRRGFEAGRNLDCGHCETDDAAIVTTCTVAGTAIGALATLPAGGAGWAPGMLIGFGVGVAITGVRNAIRHSECNIL